MGYVADSHVGPSDMLAVFDLPVGVPHSGIPNWQPSFRLNKEQFGYRSGPLGPEELRVINNLDQHGTWKDKTTMVEALDRIQEATFASPRVRVGVFDVHYREYLETRRDATVLSYLRRHTGATYYGQIGSQINGVNASLGPWPTKSETDAIASSIMRSYAPTRPSFNLSRFVGELRETPSLLNIFNVIGKPRSRGEQTGSAYLTWQFGIAPTVSDLERASNAVLRADELTNQFIRDSSRFVKRYGSRELDRNTHWGDPLAFNKQGSFDLDGIAVQNNYPFSTSQTGPLARSYYDIRRTLRAFSTFEYFCGDPDGYLSRMDYYRLKAQQVLGGGLTASTMWELTPWTWMSDWFFDIGSLLDYQQLVADNGLVQRSGGYIVEELISAEVSMVDNDRTPGVRYFHGTGESQVRYTRKTQRRHAGSPYSMALDWDLNDFQWAILAALGATRAGKIPLLPQ